MTHEEYVTCKIRRCRYAANPECPNSCSDCIYQHEQDEKLGIANNLTPKTGSFIGWKIIRLVQSPYTCRAKPRTFVCPDGTKKECRFALVRLQIPEDAKRSSGYGKKCRCSKAHVLDIWPVGPVVDGDGIVVDYEPYGFLDADHGYSWLDPGFEYHKGETVSVSDFDERWWEECSSGIHFFMTIKDALAYVDEVD